MKKRRVGVLDLVSQGPTRALYARVMYANLASIMPQILGVWCEEQGHDVSLVCYTGFENLLEELPDDIDVLFIGAFSRSALLAYAISNMYRQRGVVTVLGGPHARCYPGDALQHFDYVLGFTDKELVREVLQDPQPNRPQGIHLSNAGQPAALPGVEERWKWIEPTLKKAPIIKVVPMIGSLGCPYTCSFCIDANVPYQPLDFEQLKNDLRFLRTKMKRPVVGWHDPNFGVRFNDYLGAIEEAIPPDSIDFIAESSLSFLSEPNLKRLKKNGFKALLPGIESWYDLGNKSKVGRSEGWKKMERVSDHVNMVLRYVPYVQTNFVLGLDCDEGDEPFEITKEFVERTPGAFPGYSLLSAFGRAAEVNLNYQRENRVLGFPFHFLDNNKAMNVRPKNYDWVSFYDHVIDLTRHTFSWPMIFKRYRAVKATIPRWMNVVRAVSSEGFGRLKYHRGIRAALQSDRELRNYFEGESTELPPRYEQRVRKDLGPLWDQLPTGALHHDPMEYIKAEEGSPALAVQGAS